MSFDADALMDRRRLKRRLFFWRFGAVIAVVLAFIVLLPGRGFHHAHIARVELDGLITESRALQKMLQKIEEDDNVKAVLLSIDSPGGTTTGAEALYQSVRTISTRKPVVAVLGTVAASGGYIAALSADHIVARGNTLTGSIGVLMQWPDVTGLMDKIGVEMEAVKSAPLKAEPDPFHKTSPEARKATQALVESSYQWFLGLVRKRRKLDNAGLNLVGDGRVYTGWQAVENGLVDEIGGEQEALAWLAAKHGVAASLPVEDWHPERTRTGLLTSATETIADSAFAGLLGSAEKVLQTKRLTLDGLISVWHPQAVE